MSATGSRLIWFNSQWRHLFRYERRSPLMLRTQSSSPLWRRGLRCAEERRRLCKDVVRDHSQRKSLVHSPFAELFVERSNHSSFGDYAKPTDTNIGQVSPDDGTCLDDHLPTQDNVLGATEHCLPTYSVSAGLKVSIVVTSISLLPWRYFAQSTRNMLVHNTHSLHVLVLVVIHVFNVHY